MRGYAQEFVDRASLGGDVSPEELRDLDARLRREAQTRRPISPTMLRIFQEEGILPAEDP